MTPELRTKYNEQVKDLYAAIGKACVDFEHMCHSLRFGILRMLEAHGLANQQVSQVMLADLTARPLLSMYQALLAEALNLTKNEQSICDKLCSNIQKLIKRRNDIIHATWPVGFAGCEDTDFSKVTGHKWKLGKEGLILQDSEVDAQHFLAFADECQEMSKVVMFVPVIHKLGSRIEDNFHITSEGKVARQSEK